MIRCRLSSTATFFQPSSKHALIGQLAQTRNWGWMLSFKSQGLLPEPSQVPQEPTIFQQLLQTGRLLLRDRKMTSRHHCRRQETEPEDAADEP